MMIAITRLGFPLAAAALLAGALAAGAQEHPEHPEDAPEPKKVGVSMAAVAEEIKEYVKEDARLKGGRFLLWDEKQNAALALTLEKVHEDKLARTAEDTYFACADFKATDGKKYDLDFFLGVDEEGDLEVVEITVHKQDGKERYGWKEEGGVWKREAKE